MPKSYVLKGTENEYLLVIRAEDRQAIYNVIDVLSSTRNKQIKELAVELEKSLNDDISRGDPGKAGSKNKGKSTAGNNGRRRKAKNT